MDLDPITVDIVRYKLDGIAGEIKSRLKDKCRAALLTGDAARGRLAPGRPLPLAAVEGGPERFGDRVALIE